MVKVVGKDPKVVKKVTCRGCASKLEYIDNDIQSWHGTDYGGGPDGGTYIKCPKCNKDVILSRY